MAGILQAIFESFLRARQRELANDAASLAAVSHTWASLAADFRRSIEDASTTEAKITDTVDLEMRFGLALIEQRSELQSKHAIDLEEQERQHRRDNQNALQKQKQQFDEELDSALQTQKQELEQTQKELQEDKDVAESALIKERQDRYFIQQTLLHKITKASRYFGFEMPEDFDFIDKVDMAFQLGKLNASRVCRRAFDELSERLNVRLEQWPSNEEIFFQEHTDEYMALLTSQVDRLVQACDDRIGTEQCRTTDVRRASLISKIEVTEQASNAIGDLRAQLAAKDKLWGQVVTSLEACLVAKDQQIDALTERLRLQTQMLDETHALLKQIAGAAAESVE
ncbi:hypothetical protein J4E93_004111 [Alternaria ventricosa]|uniref:uncharacterized protein n=1 Tax=Alternaria ventricosa TaxID=1187951 RepID=UPI0020C43F9B|nr:uncharacterized protein J4E93_004111 [Alternaria ventricosa]KAI4647701.1 hypothetical protein J4E93_004111 [Alternaria ventricosa]